MKSIINFSISYTCEYLTLHTIDVSNGLRFTPYIIVCRISLVSLALQDLCNNRNKILKLDTFRQYL